MSRHALFIVHGHAQGMGVDANSPLIQEIRLATAKYKDINMALHKETGW